MEWYTYDYAGNITSTTDANGGTITYHYNSLGQVSEITDQEGYREVFYYDEEGRPELHIDRKGNTVRTRYNMDNRLLYRRAEDAKGRNAVTNQYVYYPDGRLKEAVGGGVTSLVGQGRSHVQAPIQNRTCPTKAYGFSPYIHLTICKTD